MLQRYCFNGCLASISYVVMSVLVLFCVGLDFGWDSRYLVGIGIYFGKPKKKETFIYNSS